MRGCHRAYIATCCYVEKYFSHLLNVIFLVSIHYFVLHSIEGNRVLCVIKINFQLFVFLGFFFCAELFWVLINYWKWSSLTKRTNQKYTKQKEFYGGEVGILIFLFFKLLKLIVHFSNEKILIH